MYLTSSPGITRMSKKLGKLPITSYKAFALISVLKLGPFFLFVLECNFKSNGIFHICLSGMELCRLIGLHE